METFADTMNRKMASDKKMCIEITSGINPEYEALKLTEALNMLFVGQVKSDLFVRDGNMVCFSEEESEHTAAYVSSISNLFKEFVDKSVEKRR